MPTPASFLSSPPRNSITVVLGQHFFNRTTDVTQTFGIEKYVPYSLYSVFNPSNHDLGELRVGCGLRTPNQSPDKSQEHKGEKSDVRGALSLVS